MSVDQQRYNYCLGPITYLVETIKQIQLLPFIGIFNSKIAGQAEFNWLACFCERYMSLLGVIASSAFNAWQHSSLLALRGSVFTLVFASLVSFLRWDASLQYIINSLKLLNRCVFRVMNYPISLSETFICWFLLDIFWLISFHVETFMALLLWTASGYRPAVIGVG